MIRMHGASRPYYKPTVYRMYHIMTSVCCRVPTPDWTRNISWYQFYKYNLSYLHITEFGYMDLNYQQTHYAFWRDYFPTVSIRPPSKCLLSLFLYVKVDTFMFYGVYIVLYHTLYKFTGDRIC